MKKLFALITFASLAVVPLHADPTLVPVVHIVNPSNGNGTPNRSPILVPVLYIDGYTLTASDGTLGSTIQILDEDDNVVFTTYVSVEGDINLPATLSGTYTIRVIRGSQTFEGALTL